MSTGFLTHDKTKHPILRYTLQAAKPEHSKYSLQAKHRILGIFLYRTGLYFAKFIYICTRNKKH